MGRLLPLVAVVALGCGRLGYDAQGDDNGTIDAATIDSSNPDIDAEVEGVDASTATSSVQTGLVTLPATFTEVAHSITPVAPANSMLLFSYGCDTTLPEEAHVSGSIATGNAIEFNRAAGGPELTIRYYVLTSSQIRVQHGVTDINSAIQQITISAVSLERAVPFVTFAVSGSQFGEGDFASSKMADATTVETAFQNAQSGQMAWQVVEFLGATVQRGLTTLIGTENSLAIDVGSIDPETSWLVYSYRVDETVDTTDPTNKMVRGYIADSGLLVFDRDGTGVNALISWSLIRFNDGTRVDSGALNLADGVLSVAGANPQFDLERSLIAAGALGKDGRVAAGGDPSACNGWSRLFMGVDGTRAVRERANGQARLRYHAVEFPGGGNGQ